MSEVWLCGLGMWRKNGKGLGCGGGQSASMFCSMVGLLLRINQRKDFQETGMERGKTR